MESLYWTIGGGAALVTFIAVLATGQRQRPERLGMSGGLFGIADELFAPSRQETMVELNQQMILPAPAPLPADDDLGIGLRADARRIVIRVP